MSVRVLVAEDDPYHRELTCTLLRREGFEVLSAMDGAEALAMARREHPVLLVSDINMPHMDGYEVARALRREVETETIQVIFLTARNQDIDVLRGYEAGADYYLTKPFQTSEFISTVREVLTNAGIAMPTKPEA